MKTFVVLTLVLSWSFVAECADYVGRLGGDLSISKSAEGGDLDLVVEHDVTSDTDGLLAPAPVPPMEGASSDRPSPPGDPAPPSLFIHTIEVGLHKGTATHIGGSAFITCNHLRRNNPQNTIKIDGVQYGGTIYGLDDSDLCLFLLDNVPDLPATKAVKRPLKEGEILTLVGKVTGTIQGTVRYDRKFNDGSVWLETPGQGIVPGDSGGGAFDTEGNLVAVVVADANDSDHVFVMPLNLEKNRWPKHAAILQEQPMTVTDSLIKGVGTETLLFTASWCGPCRTVKGSILPKIEEVGYKVTLVDTDQHHDLSVKYDIMSIPMWVILKDGVEVHRESYGNVDTLLKAVK